MYNLIRSIVLSRTIGAQWQEINIGDKLVCDIFAMYSGVFLELSNEYIETNVFVDFYTLKDQHLAFQGTLNELLVELADTTLEHADKLPSTSLKFARYSNAVQSAYKVNNCKIGFASIENGLRSELPDLRITRPSYLTEMEYLHTHCLLSVNGYYHMTDTDGTFAYVKDGSKTLTKCNMNHVGILSFLDIGKVDKVKLDPTKIRPMAEDSLLKDKIYFDVDVDLTNKSCILVLGGYLIFPQENVFWQRGEKSFAFNINTIPYLERIYESNLYLDLSELELQTEESNPNKLSVAQLYSDDFIRKYMTMSQSFLVVVDTPNLTTRTIGIRSSNMPGKFTTYQDPSYPLIVGHGKVAEYWKNKDGVKWSVSVRDSYKRNYLLSTELKRRLEAVSDQVNPMTPFTYSRGFLLEIAGYR